MILRVYDPAECDERGVPLGWERCRMCGGWGKGHHEGRFRSDPDGPEVCPICDGHGSLKAAALDRAGRWKPCPDGSGLIRNAKTIVRCEGCGHPMSEGTWEHDARVPEGAPWIALVRERGPQNMDGARAYERCAYGVHYSYCDEGCRHRGPVRWRCEPPTGWVDGEVLRPVGEMIGRGDSLPYEASWRLVDVRTLGWPHDLRSEKLAVLCLHCYAERSGTNKRVDVAAHEQVAYPPGLDPRSRHNPGGA